MNQPVRRAPIINAPPLLTLLAGVFISLHAVRVFGGEMLGLQMLYHGAVYPERFWGALGMGPDALGGGVAPPYSGPITLVFSLFATAFLHGDWLHVIINSAIFIAAGKPVYDDLARGRGRGTAPFLVLFFMSVAAGSLFHLAANYPAGSVAIGASGGVSGLIAAVLLIQQGRAERGSARILSPSFIRVSAAFIVGNLLLWIMGPSLLGASIAWQAHIGGYIFGALFYRWMVLQRA